MLTYFLFIVGFVLLVFGSNWLVEGASAIAKRFNISDIAIGLTIVAFGTSTPELVVSVTASLKGSTDVAIGNVLGSNIFNIFGILGVSAIFFPLTVNNNTTWKEIPLSFLAAILVAVCANDIFFDGNTANVLSRIDGLVFLAFFMLFMVYVFSIAKSSQTLDNSSNDKNPIIPIWKSILFIIIGLTGLVFGGKWIVEGAVSIAKLIGLSESIIGLTIVAIGTSLPELATSIAAVRKKNVDIAIGNVVGSNIFNIFFILGTSATISPLPLNAGSNIDISLALLASLMLFAFIFIGKGRKIERYEGILFVLIYIFYVAFLILK